MGSHIIRLRFFWAFPFVAVASYFVLILELMGVDVIGFARELGWPAVILFFVFFVWATSYLENHHRVSLMVSDTSDVAGKGEVVAFSKKPGLRSSGRSRI